MSDTSPNLGDLTRPSVAGDQAANGALALHLDGCHLSFASTTGGRLAVLDGLSLAVAPGEFVALVGPSGCGKSTALRLATAAVRPSSGSVSVLGGDPDDARKRRQIAVAFQDPALLPWRTVFQNVALPLEIAGKLQSHRDATVVNAIAQVGLTGFEEAQPHQLSGGMRQRVAIARALTTSPRLLLMDEPFSAVDELTRDRLNVLLLDAWADGAPAIVFVTHSIEEAVFLADRVVVLTRRPARAFTSIQTGLPRPRTLSMKRDGATFEVVARVRAALEEAMR